MPQTNWAGNYTYRALAVHRPATVEQLQEIVAAEPRLRALGSRHSFTGIGDSAVLVSLAGLPADVAVDPAAGTVSLGAGVTYGELAGPLAASGVALANLASLPHISVAGAVATGTHGSGDRNGSLATSVAALELVTSDGSMIRLARGDAGFAGAIVSLGALGVVTRVTLDVEPTFEVSQRVHDGLSWESLCSNFDAVFASGYSVSVFTLWDASDEAGRLWVKRRVVPDGDSDSTEGAAAGLFGAAPATAERHPIPGIDPVNCTPQLGVPGLWSDRLPHFRLGFTPSAGEEIQSEFLVARRHAVSALEALRERAGTFRALVQTSEIRTIAADELWLSPAYGRDSVGIHFTWVRDQAAVERALVGIEAALSPFDARPHWGKLFRYGADRIAASYERLPDFRRLLEQLDPRGAFRNEWLEQRVLGST